MSGAPPELAATPPGAAGPTDPADALTRGLLRRLRDPLAPGPYRGRQYLLLVVVIGAIALVVPRLVSTRSDQFLVNLWLVYAIAGIGFYWVFGLAGRFAFCQTLMMAMGGYTSAFVVRHLDDGAFLVGVVAGTAAAGLLALAIGWAARRTRDFYFAIATLAATEIGLVVFRHARDFTGPNGTVPGVPAPEIGGLRLRQDGDIFWLLLAVLALTLLVGIAIERSPLRRDAIASRDLAMVASTQGVPVVRIQILLFVLGSAFGGLAGALFAHWTGSLGVESFGMQASIGIFLILLLGGSDSLWGPVIGSAIYVSLPQLLDVFERYQTVAYGLVLLVVVIVFPHGVVGGLRRVRAFVSARRAVDHPPSPVEPEEAVGAAG